MLAPSSADAAKFHALVESLHVRLGHAPPTRRDIYQITFAKLPTVQIGCMNGTDIFFLADLCPFLPERHLGFMTQLLKRSVDPANLGGVPTIYALRNDWILQWSKQPLEHLDEVSFRGWMERFLGDARIALRLGADNPTAMPTPRAARSRQKATP